MTKTQPNASQFDYDAFFSADESFYKIVRPLTDEDFFGQDLKLSEEERKIYSAIERARAPYQEHDYKPLWLKRSQPQEFRNDEFTDYDVRSYYAYLFNKKYPQIAPFANYASVGIVQGAKLLKEYMVKTMRENKWGFYSYSNGPHWVLVVISPDREVVCIDSIGNGKRNIASINKSIFNDISEAFKELEDTNKIQISLYGLDTQVGVQCGLHTVLAAEEIIKSICERVQKNHEPAEIYQLLCLEKIKSAVINGVINDIDVAKTPNFSLSESLSRKNIEILKRAKDGLEGGELKSRLEQLLSNRNSSRETYANWYKEYKSQIEAQYQAKFDQLRPNFSAKDVKEKCLNSNDPIRNKAQPTTIIKTRWETSNQQFEDQRLNALDAIYLRLEKEIFANATIDTMSDEEKAQKFLEFQQHYDKEIDFQADQAILKEDEFIARVISSEQENSITDFKTKNKEEAKIDLEAAKLDFVYDITARFYDNIRKESKICFLKNTEANLEEDFKERYEGLKSLISGINSSMVVEIPNLEKVLEQTRFEVRLEMQAKEEEQKQKKTSNDAKVPELALVKKIEYQIEQKVPEEIFKMKDSFKTEIPQNLVVIKPSDPETRNPQFRITTSNEKILEQANNKESFTTNLRNTINELLRNPKINEELNEKELGAVILIAIKNGGIGHSPDLLPQDLQKLKEMKVLSEETDLDKLEEKAKRFSKKFQVAAKDRMFFTGNENAIDLTGMRLKRLDPEYARGFLGDEDYSKICQEFDMSKILEQESEHPRASLEKKAILQISDQTNHHSLTKS